MLFNAAAPNEARPKGSWDAFNSNSQKIASAKRKLFKTPPSSSKLHSAGAANVTSSLMKRTKVVTIWDAFSQRFKKSTLTVANCRGAFHIICDFTQYNFQEIC